MGAINYLDVAMDLHAGMMIYSLNNPCAFASGWRKIRSSIG
jgi:hypothetical protein